MLEAKQYFNEFQEGVKLGAGEVVGAGSSWGSQTLVLSVHSTSTASASATTPIAVTPSGGAPVAATVKFVEVINTNGVAAVWEVASSTNTKAFVITGNTQSLGLVIGATSILNVGVAAGEVLNFVSVTAGGSATLILGLETAN